MPSTLLSWEETSGPVSVGIRVALVVEYDGTRFFGFQWQDDRVTVQQEIETAIFRLTGERLRVVGASRTDTGTHALGQVVSFWTQSDLPLRSFVTGMNHFLPKDVAVKKAFCAPDGFHVQRSAVSRVYDYHVVESPTRSPMWERTAWVIRGPVDVGLMRLASQVLMGEHDFASFTSKTDGNTVRRVDRVDVEETRGIIVFTIEASSFLMHQIRNTVGALVEVGAGRASVSEFYSIMERRSFGLAGPKAPACGLRLVRVNYPRFTEEGTYEDL